MIPIMFVLEINSNVAPITQFEGLSPQHSSRAFLASIEAFHPSMAVLNLSIPLEGCTAEKS
jgi:hypothetical protein